MEKLVKVFNIFVYGVTMILFFIIGFFTLPRLISITPFVVQSGSMEPAIETGSVVFVNEKDIDVDVGDIITFGISTGKQKGVYVTHRVHKIDEEDQLIQTKGDANDSPDGYLSKDAIVGTVMFHIPKVGFVLENLQEQHGYLIVILSVFILNCFSLLLNNLIK